MPTLTRASCQLLSASPGLYAIKHRTLGLIYFGSSSNIRRATSAWVYRIKSPERAPRPPNAMADLCSEPEDWDVSVLTVYEDVDPSVLGDTLQAGLLDVLARARARDASKVLNSSYGAGAISRAVARYQQRVPTPYDMVAPVEELTEIDARTELTRTGYAEARAKLFQEFAEHMLGEGLHKSWRIGTGNAIKREFRAREREIAAHAGTAIRARAAEDVIRISRRVTLNPKRLETLGDVGLEFEEFLKRAKAHTGVSNPSPAAIEEIRAYYVRRRAMRAAAALRKSERVKKKITLAEAQALERARRAGEVHKMEFTGLLPGVTEVP